MKNYFFFDFVIDEDKIYFPMCCYNAFCKGELCNDSVSIVGVSPDVPVDTLLAYSGCYKTKEYVIFFPNHNGTDNIVVYNTLEQECFIIKNEKKLAVRNWTVFEKNGDIYIVSLVGAQVFKLDLNKREIKVLTYPELTVTDCIIDARIVRKDDSVFIPCNQEKKLIIFDLREAKFRYYSYPVNISYISSISVESDLLWVTGEDKKLFSWRVGENEATEVAVFPDDIKQYFQDKAWFKVSFIHKDFLWLFPRSANMILKYKMSSKEFEKFMIEGEEEDGAWEKERYHMSKYESVFWDDDRVFFFSSKTRILYEFDLSTNNIEKHCLRIKPVYRGEKYPLQNQEIIYENGHINSLDIFISTLSLI